MELEGGEGEGERGEGEREEEGKGELVEWVRKMRSFRSKIYDFIRFLHTFWNFSLGGGEEGGVREGGREEREGGWVIFVRVCLFFFIH